MRDRSFALDSQYVNTDDHILKAVNSIVTMVKGDSTSGSSGSNQVRIEHLEGQVKHLREAEKENPQKLGRILEILEKGP